MGLASRRPWQEGGSQESERNRQRVTFIMSDNFVGGCRLRRSHGTSQVLGSIRRDERSNQSCRMDGTQYVHLQSRLLVMEIFISLLVDQVINAADEVSRY